MNTNTDAVQELKSERVQEEMVVVAEPEPYLVSLKSERVQEPELFGDGERAISVIELAMSRMIAVTIELQALQAVVTLHGAQGESPGQTS